MKIDGISPVSAKLSNDTPAQKVNDSSFKAVFESAFNENDEKKLREACRDFETLFINMTYKQMRATIQKSDLLPDNFARQTFEGMLDDEMAAEASKGNGMGLGEMLYKQLSANMKNSYRPIQRADTNTGEK